MKRSASFSLLIGLLLTAPAGAGSLTGSAALGGGLGGALGAFVGSEIGGTSGAVVGGAIGGAAGAAIATQGRERQRVVIRERPVAMAPYYWDDDPPRYRYYAPVKGRFCPPGKAKKGRC